MTLYQPLPPIRLEKPLVGSFLDSLPRLPVPERASGGGPEWGSGVTSPRYSGIDPGAWPGASCFAGFGDDWATLTGSELDLCVPEQKLNTAGGGCVIDKFDPFIVYHYFDASAINGDDTPPGVNPESADRARSMVDNWLDAQFSAAVARAFYRGAPEDGLVVDGANRNPIPRTSAADLNAVMGSATPIHPDAAIANLLGSYYGCRLAGGAVLHVPPLILPYLIRNGIVSQVGTRYMGPGGVVVVSDPGQPSGPADSCDGDFDTYDPEYLGTTLATPVESGSAWCFVTGPVEVSYSEPKVMLDEAEQVYDVRLNRWLYVVERRAIFRWDPSCCFAVLACAESGSCGEA